MSRPVVALFVDPRGPYPSRVDSWDASRDAHSCDRTDAAIVAHPPCGPWGRLRHLSTKDDPRHGPYAVELVRRFGGVLEHPAQSRLWEACGLPKPRPGLIVADFVDTRRGFSVELDQCDFGHVARKRTWLYIVGLDASDLPPRPAKREPTHWASGSRGKSSRTGSPVPPGIKVCSASQRRKTPPAFADWLIEVASRCLDPSLLASGA